MSLRRWILVPALCWFSVSGLSLVSDASDWTNWRGPASRGVVEGDYPIRWNSSESVAWTYEIPGRGGSTPVELGDLIVLTTGAEERNWVLALDHTGKEVWRTEVGTERAGKHQKGSGSNPSPVSDGEHVFVYFKSGDFACLDRGGKVVWHRNLQADYGEDTLWWDLGTSPILSSQHVIVACMHSGPSYVAAFDKRSGEVVWKQDRNLPAPEEANQSYSTPIVVEQDGRETIVVLGADHVTAHDAQTGETLWTVGGLNPEQNGYFRSIASPVATSDLIIAPYARGSSLTAIRLGGSGDVTKSHVAWASTAISSDVPTPAYYEGSVYVLDDKGRVARINPQDGKVVEELELERNRFAYSASPIIAGEHLYALREDGTTFVVHLGDKMEVVSKNELEEMAVASPAFIDGRILIRAGGKLWCLAR